MCLIGNSRVNNPTDNLCAISAFVKGPIRTAAVLSNVVQTGFVVVVVVVSPNEDGERSSAGRRIVGGMRITGTTCKMEDDALNRTWVISFLL